MGDAQSTEAPVERLVPPTGPTAGGQPTRRADLRTYVPTSRRLREVLFNHDVSGERAIAAAQGAIALFVVMLHLVAQLGKGLQMANPWVLLTLTLLIASSGLRLVLTRDNKLPERALDVLNLADIGIFLGLIWSYQFAYQHPAGGVLKAPSQALLFVLVALRALRFHPRPVLISGAAAALGWALVVCAAIARDGTLGLTRDYVAYLGSHKILIGAEVERLVALAALAVFLAVATRNARQILSRAAHASDYAEALNSARRHLDEATSARTRAELALAELDRHKAELSEQNRRFDAALENMSQGICMFDKEQRLIVCNRRYARMYGLPDERVRPGTTLREILDHRVVHGLYGGGSPQEYIRDRLAKAEANVATTNVQEFTDGRSIAIVHQPTPDGGWVATHEDVTEVRRIEARLAHIAHHDALTDLPNRALLRERLDRGAVRVARSAPAGGAGARPRPLQGRQRHAGPPRRRCPAQAARRAAARLRGRGRHGGAAGRRRVRHRACATSRSAEAAAALAQGIVEAIERTLRSR